MKLEADFGYYLWGRGLKSQFIWAVAINPLDEDWIVVGGGDLVAGLEHQEPSVIRLNMATGFEDDPYFLGTYWD